MLNNLQKEIVEILSEKDEDEIISAYLVSAVKLLEPEHAQKKVFLFGVHGQFIAKLVHSPASSGCFQNIDFNMKSCECCHIYEHIYTEKVNFTAH